MSCTCNPLNVHGQYHQRRSTEYTVRTYSNLHKTKNDFIIVNFDIYESTAQYPAYKHFLQVLITGSTMSNRLIGNSAIEGRVVPLPASTATQLSTDPTLNLEKRIYCHKSMRVNICSSGHCIECAFIVFGRIWSARRGLLSVMTMDINMSILYEDDIFFVQHLRFLTYRQFIFCKR